MNIRPHKQIFIVLYLYFVSFAALAADALQETVEHVVWTNAPIRLMLPVGTERRIDFPVPVKIEWPDLVRDKTSNLQIRENGSIYWTVKEPFDRTRVNVITDTGYSYLLDVEAKKGASNHPLIVIDDRVSSSADGDTESDSPRAFSRFYEYDYRDLTRYAAKNLISPPRLAEPLPGVMRVPVDTTVDYPLYKGGDLITRPIAQWKAATMPALYVTAVLVKSNNTASDTFLDPRLLRGELLAATPQHDYVKPKDQDGDSTVWYLVTARPFGEVAP